MEVRREAVLVLVVVCCTAVATGQTEWVEHPDNPLTGPGEPGSWDERGHWLGDVVFDGSMYHMWFTGVGGDWWDIGHATSTDGVAWTMDQANPVLLPGDSGQFDDAGITGLAVVHEGTLFHMWYTGWQSGSPEGVGYATSPDGTVWTKYEHNPVMSGGTPGSWNRDGLFPGSVILNGNTYQMWAAAMGDDGFVRIGYAESSDGIVWIEHPEPVVDVGKEPGSFDSWLVGHPDVAFDGHLYHMWYFGDSGDGHRRIGYATSVDGIEWAKYPENPVLERPIYEVDLPNVLIEGSTFRMWFEDYDGSAYWTSLATSDCCVAMNFLQTVPAAALASGAQGSFYQTDVDLNNAGSQAIEYAFTWLPRGENNSDPMMSETFTLGAGMSVRYTNVLAEVFGLEPNALGAFSIQSSSPELLCMSRTYNLELEKSGGTFGQAIPAVKPGEFITHGERRRILFGSQGTDYRTNIGCINGTEMLGAVEVELFNAEGVSLTTERLRLDPWSNDQLNAPFSDYAPVNGYVDVWTVMPNGSFYCYGSVLDNITSDPTTILPK